MASVSDVITFSDLCVVFEKTVNSKTAAERLTPISAFIKHYKHTAEALKNTNATADTSFYPALRLILPQLERERGPFGIKESTFAKKIIKIMCLPHGNSDANRLLNFRTAPNNNQIKDFADAAYWVLRKHFSHRSSLTIKDVNGCLDSLAEKNKENDPRALDDELLKLLRQTCPDEQKWLIRIILKDLRLGMGSDRILKIFHLDAADYFSATSSLSKLCIKVCETLTDPNKRLFELEITMFSPFRPMLSARCDASQFKKTVTGNKALIVEQKFDGERFQLHMDNGNFKYFSRNGYDYSSSYGETYSSGLYTPLLRNAFHPDVKTIILDGEMMGWNTKLKKYGSKGMNFDVKHLQATSVHRPCFCVFDIVLLNDKVLTNKPLEQRLSILANVFKPVEGVIARSSYMRCKEPQEILNALNESMDREEEGIVLKDCGSVYKSNDRKAGWWKLKLEFFEGVMSDLDVIIMGGYYGEGRHRSQISGFLVGVVDKSYLSPDHTKDIPAYMSLAKIQSGLSYQELKEIQEKLASCWKKMGDDNPENYGLFWGKEKPDVWIPPNDSCVLVVRASELIKIHTTDYKTDYTLRFPRIQQVRFDKPISDCLTLEELQELTNSSKSVEKLNKRHLELSDIEPASKKRTFKPKFVVPEIQPVEAISNLMNGHEFCVLTGTENWSKANIETEIRENGGSIVNVEGPKTFCILVGDSHARVKFLKENDAPWDIVKLEWLKNVLRTQRLHSYTPANMLHTCCATRLRFLGTYDKFGDSFLEDCNLDTVEQILATVKQMDNRIYLMPQEIQNIEKEIKYDSRRDVFNSYIAYFDSYKIINDPASAKVNDFSIEEVDFENYGGICSKTFDDMVNVVIINMSIEGRQEEMEQYLRLNDKRHCRIVDKSFIFDVLKKE